MRLLNIEASPRRAASVSIAVAAAFVDAFRDAHPCVDVDTMNVWDEHLPDFDSEAIGAKYKAVSRQPMSAPERAVWERIQSLAERFREADFIVLIDLACQRNLLFTFDGEAYGPKIKARRALVIYVRGQSDETRFAASAATGFEHQALHRILAEVHRRE